MNNELETILEKALDAAVDIVVAEMDCHHTRRVPVEAVTTASCSHKTAFPHTIPQSKNHVLSGKVFNMTANTNYCMRDHHTPKATPSFSKTSWRGTHEE